MGKPSVAITKTLLDPGLASENMSVRIKSKATCVFVFPPAAVNDETAFENKVSSYDLGSVNSRTSPMFVYTFVPKTVPENSA